MFVNTVWRWCQKGLGNGIRLKSVLIGGIRYTSRKWIEDFIQARTQASELDSLPAPKLRTQADAAGSLQKMPKPS